MNISARFSLDNKDCLPCENFRGEGRPHRAFASRPQPISRSSLAAWECRLSRITRPRAEWYLPVSASQSPSHISAAYPPPAVSAGWRLTWPTANVRIRRSPTRVDSTCRQHLRIIVGCPSLPCVPAARPSRPPISSPCPLYTRRRREEARRHEEALRAGAITGSFAASAPLCFRLVAALIAPTGHVGGAPDVARQRRGRCGQTAADRRVLTAAAVRREPGTPSAKRRNVCGRRRQRRAIA